MHRVLPVLLVLTGSGMPVLMEDVPAADTPRAPEAEVQQLKNELSELKQLIEQISKRLEGIELRLEGIELRLEKSGAATKPVIRVVPAPGPYRRPPWTGIDAGMLLDALEHKQRFGPVLDRQPLQFEPQPLGRPAPLPGREVPPRDLRLRE